VDHPRRSPESRARDPHRHPRETLAFFDVRPCQTVVEVNPGGGWYTEILAPVLRRHGDLRIATPGAHHGVPAQAEGQQKLMALLRADPATFGRVHRGDFQPPRRMDFGPANSADRILTFRNTHNWINNGVAWRVYGAALRALKPGGLLGVVQHRAAPDADPIVAARSGYVPEPWLIDTLQRIGFEFVASTEVNANPRDTKDHPAGVWTLPPSYRLGNQNRAAYAEIGESDRMTLLFRKPAHAHRHGRR
jgi:predicted methyltransferase